MVKIHQDLCTGCSECVKECPMGLLKMEGDVVKTPASCFECGHCMAICPENAVFMEGYNSEEILEYEEPRFKIEPELLANFIKFRRSVRRFTEEPVAKEDIEQLIEAARYTPTSANRQYVRTIVTTPETTKALLPIVLKFLSEIEPDEVDLSRLRVTPWYINYLAGWKAWYRSYLETGKDFLFRGAKQLIITVVENGCEVDGALAAGNMALMAAALGIGTCFVGFGGFGIALNPEAKSLLGIGDHENVALMLAIGHHQVKYHRTVNRKPANWKII